MATEENPESSGGASAGLEALFGSLSDRLGRSATLNVCANGDSRLRFLAG